jgi:hypothetical protein
VSAARPELVIDATLYKIAFQKGAVTSSRIAICAGKEKYLTLTRLERCVEKWLQSRQLCTGRVRGVNGLLNKPSHQKNVGGPKKPLREDRP